MASTKKKIKSALNAFSFLSDVHVVGGAVRDAIIGRESDDIDLATSDTPEKVMEKCRERGFTVIETGVQHGTVTAVSSEGEFEITTFRKDVSTDGRNATVEWAESIEEDLERRDFTINAMAWGNSGVVDPFGGREDLALSKIRAVGDPRDRFREDFLRIVRALRFASRFGFEIGDSELEAMEEMAGRVTENVSVERIVMEVKKALADDRPEQFLRELRRLGILEDALGTELDFWSTDLPFMRSQLFDTVESLEDATLRFEFLVGGLAHLSDMDEEEIQSQLRLPSDISRRGTRIHEAWRLSASDPTFRPPWSQIRTFQASFRDVLESVRAVKKAVFPTADLPLLREHDTPLDPIVSGQDFIDRGHKEGPVIGDLVNAAHRTQLRRAETDPEVLIQKAESEVLTKKQPTP